MPSLPAPRRPYVLFVCGPEKRKNAGLLFTAFTRAFASREVELVIAGTISPSDRRLLEHSGISFSHVQPDDFELRKLYSGALAVTVPSSAEGFGLTAIEAMACGAPVLAANAAGLPEACASGAELLDPYDIEVWTRALRRIREDPDFRTALQRRAARRSAQFDRSAPAREMLALFREIAVCATRGRRFHATAL